MKKIHYLLGTFALATLFSCSSEDVVEQRNDAPLLTRQAIAFTSLSKGATRSTVINNTSDILSFRVYATWTGTTADSVWIQGTKYFESTLPTMTNHSAYMGFKGTEGDQNGLEIQNNSGAFDYKDQTMVQYWPYTPTLDATDNTKITGYTCAPLSFYAVTPAATKMNLAWDELATYTYTTPTDVASMTDICFAKNEVVDNSAGSVTMHFSHLLSQVIFKAKKGNNYVAEIKEIEIGGFKNKAKYNLQTANLTNDTTTAQGKTGYQPELDASATGMAFSGFSGSAINLPDQEDADSPYQLTTANQALLLIPQDVTAWQTGGTVDAGANNGGYLKVTYRAKVTGSEKWATGEGDGYTTRYFPLSVKWKAGRKYVYSLLIGGAKNPEQPADPDNPNPNPGGGGGFDVHGNPIAPSVPITFAVEVDEWNVRNVNVTL